MIKRIVCIFTISVFFLCAYLPLTANAIQDTDHAGIIEVRATKDFSISIPAGESKSLKTLLPLAAGESVSIQAYYSPETASVDFGLISSDGLFYFMSESDGHADIQITVDTPGNYKFAILNNSSQMITVSGKIKY